MISRANVIKAIEESGPDATSISLERFIEVAPIVVPPNMPLPFIYRIVQAEGINYLPVVRNYGPLAVRLGVVYASNHLTSTAVESSDTLHHVDTAPPHDLLPCLQHAYALQGIVSREELVDIQNKKLDDHHLKDTIDQMSQVCGQQEGSGVREHTVVLGHVTGHGQCHWLRPSTMPRAPVKDVLLLLLCCLRDQGKIMGSMRLAHNMHAPPATTIVMLTVCLSYLPLLAPHMTGH